MAELFSYGPGNLGEFFRKNHRALLYTIIFHLLILIVLVLVKVDSLKQQQELGVMLDFTEEEPLEEQVVDLPPEWIEKVYEAREKASNRAVNVNDEINSEISTRDFVNELLDELESQKDEEFLKNREKWEEIISSYVHDDDAVTRKQEKEEQHPFTGPTTITYKFLEEPLARQSRLLTVPVYRCEGSARVEVEISVRQNGTVTDVSVLSVESETEPGCFTGAAKNAAESSIFRSDYDAPEKQKARITYQFVAQ